MNFEPDQPHEQPTEPDKEPLWAPRPDVEPAHNYDPIQPGGTDWRGRVRKALAPIVAVFVTLAKFSFVLLKFSTIFVAVAAYALIWGWKFAIGVVVLILVHELGHYIEAKREGLKPKLPIFVPFLGAYVRYTRGHPWQTVRVAIAGPILGGVASFVFYLVAKSQHSNLLVRARVLRVLHQPVQPDAVRDLRRWRGLALRGLPAARRRPAARARVVRALLRDDAVCLCSA